MKHATPRGAGPPQQHTELTGPGLGPGGSGAMYAPRPGFSGGYGGPAGVPAGAYGGMGAYGPHVQYPAGPGYGMQGYGQARSRPRSCLRSQVF